MDVTIKNKKSKDESAYVTGANLPGGEGTADVFVKGENDKYVVNKEVLNPGAKTGPKASKVKFNTMNLPIMGTNFQVKIDAGDEETFKGVSNIEALYLENAAEVINSGSSDSTPVVVYDFNGTLEYDENDGFSIVSDNEEKTYIESGDTVCIKPSTEAVAKFAEMSVTLSSELTGTAITTADAIKADGLENYSADANIDVGTTYCDLGDIFNDDTTYIKFVIANDGENDVAVSKPYFIQYNNNLAVELSVGPDEQHPSLLYVTTDGVLLGTLDTSTIIPSEYLIQTMEGTFEPQPETYANPIATTVLSDGVTITTDMNNNVTEEVASGSYAVIVEGAFTGELDSTPVSADVYVVNNSEGTGLIFGVIINPIA